jgi:hypothetical protein
VDHDAFIITSDLRAILWRATSLSLGAQGSRGS